MHGDGHMADNIAFAIDANFVRGPLSAAAEVVDYDEGGFIADSTPFSAQVMTALSLMGLLSALQCTCAADFPMMRNLPTGHLALTGCVDALTTQSAISRLTQDATPT